MAKGFNDLAPRAQLTVFVLLCVMLVVAAWQMLLGPARADLASRQARLAVLQGELTRAQATAARLPAAERDVRSLERRLLETTAVLPDEKDPQDVLRNLHELASESTLGISSFTPKTIVTKTQYAEWPIELGLEGGYHELGRFFDRVASMPRLISVAELKIKVHTKPTPKNTIAATCVATTFVFRKDPAPGEPRALVSRALPTGGLQ